MRVTVFTGNQPRHLALVERLAGMAERVWAVQECATVFPGRVEDFYRRSPVMQEYFGRVIAAENRVFGAIRFLPGNVRQLALRLGDASFMEPAAFHEAMEADFFVVFGASYLKGPLCERLVERRACNLHMGVSPYYRGNSCNFWAAYDGRPEYVGATVHLLTTGLDSGPMLFHALPQPQEVDPFVLGMLAVKATHEGIVARLTDGSLMELEPIQQDKAGQMRYSRNEDFTDQVAADYMDHLLSPAQVAARLEARDLDQFLRPYLGGRLDAEKGNGQG